MPSVYINTAATCVVMYAQYYGMPIFTLEFWLLFKGCTFSTAFLVKATRKTLDSTGWLYTIDHSRYWLHTRKRCYYGISGDNPLIFMPNRKIYFPKLKEKDRNLEVVWN